MTRVGLALVAASVALGCASVAVSPRDGRAFLPSQYPSILEDWTRADEHYEQFSARIMVRAAWLSPPLLRAQLAFRAQHESLAADELDRLHKEAEAAFHSEVRFVLAVHTPEWEWNHLERGEAGVLRLRLRTSDGVEREPAKIERIPATGSDSLLYPFLEPLWVGYRVTFPAPYAGRTFDAPPGSTVTLVVTGAPGAAELVWKVDR